MDVAGDGARERHMPRPQERPATSNRSRRARSAAQRPWRRPLRSPAVARGRPRGSAAYPSCRARRPRRSGRRRRSCVPRRGRSGRYCALPRIPAPRAHPARCSGGTPSLGSPGFAPSPSATGRWRAAGRFLCSMADIDAAEEEQAPHEAQREQRPIPQDQFPREPARPLRGRGSHSGPATAGKGTIESPYQSR